MMILNDFENYVPYKIWARGEEYYECDAVKDLEETEPEEWIAIVEGTEDYEVEISLEGKKIIYWSCDCPYEGDICKHVVATVLAIRNNRSKQKRFLSAREAKLMEKQQTTLKDKKVEDILAFVSSDQLSDFVLEYASRHTECKQALLEKFLPKPQANGKSSKNYGNDIRKCFNDSYVETKGRYGGYYEPTMDWNKVGCELNKYLKKAKLLIEQHCFEDAAAIATGILQAIGENYIEEELVYHNEFEANFYCECSGELLLDIIYRPEITGSQKIMILNEVRQIEKLATYREYDVYDVNLLLSQITIATQTQEETLTYINQLIEERKSSWELYKLIEKKINILRSLRREEEVQATIDTYLYLPEIRKHEVQRFIANRQYDSAILLLDEGIHIAQKNRHLGTIRDWMEQKLSIYEETNQTINIIDLCRQLFISENGDLTYYHKLKKLIATNEWKKFLSGLMEQITFSGHGYSGQCNKMDIYVEEKDYENLLKMLSDRHSSLDMLMHYSHHLDNNYSTEIMQLFTEQINRYAEMNIGRNHYEYIEQVLKEMKKLKDGKKTVEDIVKKFRIAYKRRPAMMETLSKF